MRGLYYARQSTLGFNLKTVKLSGFASLITRSKDFPNVSINALSINLKYFGHAERSYIHNRRRLMDRRRRLSI